MEETWAYKLILLLPMAESSHRSARNFEDNEIAPSSHSYS